MWMRQAVFLHTPRSPTRPCAGVLLDVDSAGGEVGGLFDLVEQIGAIQKASAKPLWAVANECALSAAYAIVSAADRVYVTRTGEIGSVGVVAVHVDESGADAKAGLSWTFVFAGERKVDGNAHAPLSEQARAAIQADVDRLHAELCALVAANRGLTPEAVRGTQAAVYRGELAIRAGLADRVGALDLAIAEMAAEFERSAVPARLINAQSFKRSSAMAIKETEATRPTAAEPLPPAQEREPAANADPAPAPAPHPAASVTAAVTAPASDPVAGTQPDATASEKLRAEFAEIAAIAAQALRLGVVVDAADAVSKGVSPDALRRSVLDALAARAEATSIIATAPSTPMAGESSIVRRAKERAAATVRA